MKLIETEVIQLLIVAAYAQGFLPKPRAVAASYFQETN